MYAGDTQLYICAWFLLIFYAPVFYRTLMHDISNMIRNLYHCLSRLH